MKRRVFQFWLYSYLFVLFIPILITMFVLLQSSSLLLKEVRRANDTLLSQMQMSLDNQIKDIQRLGTQLSVDAKLAAYLNQASLDTAQARFSAMDLLSSLHAYSIANGTISDFYIYVKKSDYALTTSTYLESSLIYNLFHSGSGMTFEAWKTFVRDPHYGEFVNLNPGEGAAGNNLVYAQTLPIQELRDAPATLVVVLNQERLKTAIAHIRSPEEGVVLIVDRSGKTVMTTGAVGDLAFLQGGMNERQGFSTQTVDGEKVAVSYMASEATDWTYVSIVPMRIYSAKVTFLKNLIYASLALCIALGGMSAYWLTARNYRPVRSMMNLVSSKVKANMEDAKNEFSLLQSFMTESVATMDESNRKLQEQHQALRAHFLARLLKGRVDTGSALAQMLESYDLQFESDRFAVLLFQIENYEALFRDKGEQDSEKKRQFVYLIVTNIVEELIHRNHRVYSTEMDGMIACLVNIHGSGESARKDLLSHLEEANSFIRDKFFIRFSVGISEIHALWSSIPRCYEEAVEALEYKLVLGLNQLISYEVVKRPKEELYYPLDIERQLINYTMIGNYEEATDVVHRILITNVTGGTISVQLGKLLMFELVGTMLKAVEQIQLSTKEIMMEKTELIKQLTQCETFVEMEGEIFAFLKTVCDYMEGKKKSHNSDLKDQIADYIEQHLADVNLSLTSISLAFGINASYLSKFFKEQSGENLIEYVNKRRIDQAKLLLMESDVAINDMTDKLGFTNSNTFIRVFKKYEGITPGQFRQNHAKS